MMSSVKATRVALLILVLLSGPSASRAATNLVTINVITNKFVFIPTNITIHPGDTILWTNADINLHDSTHKSTNGQARLWASGSLSNKPPHNTFSFTFTNAGFYPYFCSIHIALQPQQTGMVTVVTAPSITLGSVQRTPDGKFQFRISGGNAGESCVVDACETLPNWVPILTTNFPNTACPVCPVIDFTDPATNLTQRFYRSRVFP